MLRTKWCGFIEDYGGEEGAKEGTEKKSDRDNFEDHLGLLNVVRRQPVVGSSPPL